MIRSPVRHHDPRACSEFVIHHRSAGMVE